MRIAIKGLAAEYGPKSTTAQEFEEFVLRHYDATNPGIAKLLALNKQTMIKTRSGILDASDDLLNGPNAVSIEDVNKLFLSSGVEMAARAASKAIEEWNGLPSDITHMVSVSCTVTSNPGFDHFVAKKLGLRPDLEKVLLAGIGCSGGLAGLRLAANLVLAAASQGRKAAVLVVACEVTSCLARAELDRVAQTRELHIGVTLFADGAGAVIVTPLDDGDVTHQNGNGIHAKPNGHVPQSETNGTLEPEEKAIFEVEKWTNLTVPDTEADLGFDASAFGWKVILTHRVPEITGQALPKLFKTVNIDDIPADQMDWALHPGGAIILKGAESVFKLTPEHFSASWHVYQNHGNSSSPTILQVLDTLRKTPGREMVFAAAFGPGINCEGAMLRRCLPTKKRKLSVTDQEASVGKVAKV